MNKVLLGLFTLGAAAAATVTAWSHRSTISIESKAEAAVPADPNATPVLVELFTSEGCSSCPPADKILSGLERTQPVAGARVVPLGLHVDYWNRLGWPDPFSDAQYTQRQSAYASLGSDGNYTPQAVIDGRTETVGSRKGAVEQAVLEAAKRPHASLRVDIAPRTNASAPYVVTLAAGALPPGSGSDAEAVVALTQNNVSVAVARGENAGSTLEHTGVVRTLVVAGKVPSAGASFQATLKTPPGIDAKDLHVVAFVQERGSRHILATATRDLDAAPAR